MLQVTDSAVEAVKAIVEQAEVGATGGLRIAVDEQEESVELGVEEAADPSDTVIDEDGARVFLDAASALPFGPGRDRAFADLDADVARNGAPLVALLQRNAGYLFSKRVGCVSYAGGWLAVGGLCLKANP